ncbi:MAG: hypothetical protein FD143_3436 [Ignavibacteria bacterium]|nr:MAG: hypothetical protein FD143_3436 [Ignavibacteria bacterium]
MSGKFKTMALVEEAELERLRQRQIKEYSPALKSLTQIQEQIEKLFDEPTLTDEAKSRILSNLQERFGFLLTKYKTSIAPVLDPAPLQLPLPETEKAQPALANNIGEAEQGGNDTHKIPNQAQAKIPSQFSRKFELLREFLEEHREEISTNEKQEIVIDGEPIEYSSFPDLLRCLYVRNPSMNTIGLPQFHLKLHGLAADPQMFSHNETLNVFAQLDRNPGKGSQKGMGLGHPTPKHSNGPPGKRPRLLYLYRL